MENGKTEIILTIEELEKTKEIARAEGLGMVKGHTEMSNETRECINGIKDSIDNLKDENRIAHQEIKTDNEKAHGEIVKHQKHTNGDVSDMKLWRAKVEGFLSGSTKTIGTSWIILIFVVSAIISPVVSYLFNNHNKQSEIENIQKQINDISKQLNKLELVE